MLHLLEKTLEWKGFPVKKARKHLSDIQALDASTRKAYAVNSRWEIVKYHFNHNYLYKKLLNGRIPENWEDLPVMTKRDLQKPLKERLSKGVNPGKLFINKTSGSSGDPFYFAKDAYCHAMTWAVNLDRFQRIGIDQNKHYQARFYGIPLDRMAYYKERLKDVLAARYRFSIFDLGDDKLEQYLQTFRVKKFDYINGYTSALLLFAKFLINKKTVLKKVCPTLKCCVVTSEMLFEEDRKIMQSAFGLPVYNEYGASELDLIAFENTRHQWLLNWETLFVEILDDNNQAVAYGDEGKLVITSLYNKAQPFIRYEIGDRGICERDPGSGQVVLKKLTGRTNDVATLPHGKKVPGLSFYYVTKSVMADDGQLKEFVVVQKTINHFHINYVRERGFTPAEEKRITDALQKYIGAKAEVTFQQQAMIKRTVAGKLKQFISEI